jgi:hypothetical protein
MECQLKASTVKGVYVKAILFCHFYLLGEPIATNSDKIKE